MQNIDCGTLYAKIEKAGPLYMQIIACTEIITALSLLNEMAIVFADVCEDKHRYCGANPGWPLSWCNVGRSYVDNNCFAMCGSCGMYIIIILFKNKKGQSVVNLNLNLSLQHLV